jgi:glycosyltransferase involved in cell wall biosynthesis
MKMANAFAEIGLDVTLRVLFALKTWLILSLKNEWPKNIWDYYGVEEKFRIVRLINPRVDINGYISPLIIYFSRYDLVITRNLLAANLLVKIGVPTLYELHDLEHDLINHRMMRLLENYRNRSLLGIISISQVMADELVQLSFPIEKVLIAHDGVSLHQYEKHFDKEELRKQIGLPETDYIAMYTGQRYAAENREFLIKCAIEIPQITFCIIGGSTDDKQMFQDQIDQLQIRNIKLIGYIPNSSIPKYLLASDLLLMPYSMTTSKTAMSPLKMFEYMSAKKPIISTNAPNIREVLSHNKNAILVEPDNHQLFVHSILKIYNDNKLGNRLGEQAYYDVKKYDWLTRAKKIIRFAEYRLSETT